VRARLSFLCDHFAEHLLRPAILVVAVVGNQVLAIRPDGDDLVRVNPPAVDLAYDDVAQLDSCPAFRR
jgi:hypothetical protein